MKKQYTPELMKLATGLIQRGIPFVFRNSFEGGQIIVASDDFFRTNKQIVITYDDPDLVWDAICHEGSYGREYGKLEIMGSLVDPTIMDSVEGYLNASDILERLDALTKAVQGRKRGLNDR